jgi:hypothetical protein
MLKLNFSRTINKHKVKQEPNLESDKQRNRVEVAIALDEAKKAADLK